ncbi:hypothetical protein MKX83_24110 [Cytobacillus sp. FSL M8-0252]|uniref:hypothetical protein n=1 Tax=Cytobacillus sp. FSL M8-0252 TaxID=2921621 RepID=UPI0030FC7B4F
MHDFTWEISIKTYKKNMKNSIVLMTITFITLILVKYMTQELNNNSIPIESSFNRLKDIFNDLFSLGTTIAMIFCLYYIIKNLIQFISFSKRQNMSSLIINNTSNSIDVHTPISLSNNNWSIPIQNIKEIEFINKDGYIEMHVTAKHNYSDNIINNLILFFNILSGGNGEYITIAFIEPRNNNILVKYIKDNHPNITIK